MITLICNNPENNPRICEAKEQLRANDQGDSDYTVFDLEKLDLKYCTGCWNCWWATPGMCSIDDGIDELYRSILHSERVVFIAALTMGGISSGLKRFIERMIPLIHPYFSLIGGEVHHRKRYDCYPALAAILLEESDTDAEDREIARSYFDRLVKNFYSRVDFVEFLPAEQTGGVE